MFCQTTPASVVGLDGRDRRDSLSRRSPWPIQGPSWSAGYRHPGRGSGSTLQAEDQGCSSRDADDDGRARRSTATRPRSQATVFCWTRVSLHHHRSPGCRRTRPKADNPSEAQRRSAGFCWTTVSSPRSITRMPTSEVEEPEPPSFGLNDRGQVVGTYVDADGRGHGFLLDRGHGARRDKGVFTTIDPPGALATGGRHQQPGPDCGHLQRGQQYSPDQQAARLPSGRRRLYPDRRLRC